MSAESSAADIVGILRSMTDTNWLGTRTERMGVAGKAADEIERLRAENVQLRSSLDAMVKHVSQEELARWVEARKAAIRAQGGK